MKYALGPVRRLTRTSLAVGALGEMVLGLNPCEPADLGALLEVGLVLLDPEQEEERGES